MRSTTSPATNPAVRAGPGGHERDGPSTTATAPAGACAVRGRSTTKAGPGPRSSIKIRRAGGRRRQGASSRPPAPPWTRSRHPVPGTGASRADRSSPATARRAGNPGHPLPPARAPTGRTTRPPSRPEKQPRGAPLRLPATTTDADAEHRVPGRLWEPARHPSQLPLTPTRKPIGWGADKAGRRKHPASTRRLVAAHRRPEDWPDPPQPGPDPQRPARHPQGHPGQESFPGRPRLCRQSQLRHRRSSAGILTRDTPEP